MANERLAGPAWGARAAALVFLLLFPGFFFYHTALGLGAIPAVLGGFFTPVAVAAAGPLVWAYGARVRRLGWQGCEPALGGFLLYLGALAALYAAAGANAAIARSHAVFILDALVVFIAFRLAPFEAVALRRLLLACLLAMSAIVFVFAQDGVFYLAQMGVSRNPESVATYQGFSRSYLMTYLVLVVSLRRLPARLALYGLAAATLYVNAARTEFLAMLSSIAVLEIYLTRQRLRLALLMGGALVLLRLAVLAGADYLPENRTLELLDLSQSSSANLRRELTERALATIAAHPLAGDYASYAPGNYAHNILSAWVDLGLFGFAYLVALLLWPLQRLWRLGFAPGAPRSAALALPLCFASITVLLLLASHNYPDMFIAATLGTYAHYFQARRPGTYRAPQFGPSAPRHPHLHQAMPQPGRARL